MPQVPKLNAFPVFLRVEGKVATIVGGGAEALAKARLLSQSSANLRIVTERPDPELAAFIAGAGAEHIRSYHPSVLDGSVLVFAATGERATDASIIAEARARGICANAVDRPDLCDFFTPALVNRAPVAVAIGTEGAAPVLAQRIRARIEAMLSPSLGILARLAASLRHAVEDKLPKHERRGYWDRFFDGEPAERLEFAGLPAAREAAEALLARASRREGHIVLVGAGPGAADLLTLRAQRLMMQADAIVYDALVPETVVAMGRRDAERYAVGKRKGCHSKSQTEINALLVALGRDGKRVVRLKSGDPLVFGRAGEEMQALRDAGLSYEIVPGVTSALAAAADLNLPLTLRGVSSSLVFTTGHDLKGEVLPDWARLAIGGATVAVYMGRSVAADVATRLIEAGLPPDTAVAVVENASLPDRVLMHGTLADLPALTGMDAFKGPVMTLIGDAVAGADLSRSTHLSQPAEGVRPAPGVARMAS